MQNKLLDLLKFITRNMILDESFLDFCLVSKIDPKKWPDCNVKLIALDYISMREKESHAFAAVQTSGHLGDLDGSEEHPTDSQLLRAYYEILLQEFNAKSLAQKILANPADVEKHISEYQSCKSEDELVLFASKFEDVVLESIRLTESGEALRVLPDWPTLSLKIGGFNPGRVSMLMAATGFGKTTFAINLALSSSKKFSTIYFNMEMIMQDFAEKLIMAGAGIDFKTYKQKINTNEIKIKVGNFYADIIKQKLFFSKGRSLSTQEIFAICRRCKLTHGLDFIIVDYDQKILLNTDKNTPEWKALQVSMEAFESLAKELNCHILILAQEGSEGEISGSRRSKFPASTVMRFYEDDGLFIVEAVKNRFGKKSDKVEVEYVSEKGFVKEIGEHQPVAKTAQVFQSKQLPNYAPGNDGRMGKGNFGRQPSTFKNYSDD
jgi:KaiC/GvpD/RAD55 family RecA-like ATPase